MMGRGGMLLLSPGGLNSLMMGRGYLEALCFMYAFCVFLCYAWESLEGIPEVKWRARFRLFRVDVAVAVDRRRIQAQRGGTQVAQQRKHTAAAATCTNLLRSCRVRLLEPMPLVLGVWRCCSHPRLRTMVLGVWRCCRPASCKLVR